VKGFIVFILVIFWTSEVMAVDNSISNRLIKEKSPYLLQHAHNPVNWFPWGEEAFDKAKKEDKPIFLSIGYSTCHWCHVMEEESFENLETAKILNDNFISIKVDREERPDIDSIYMSFVMAATGSGGWPMSVFLTPDQKPFYGGTYFPPEDRWGVPGFKSLLHSIAGSWKEKRAEIMDSAESSVQFLSNRVSGKSAESELSIETLEKAFHQYEAGYDPSYGGFGRAPKFPRSHVLSMLLRHWLRTRNASALRMTEDTLKAMASGGIYDQLGGGFHRYSTDGRWRIPHFEKMLYDQALLAATYLETAQATGNAEYARVARETLDYVLQRMTSPDGAFYSAEDADSPDPKKPEQKREGAFYVWEKKEIVDALGEESSQIFCYAFGVQEDGNALADPHGEFARRNVLYLAHTTEETASHFKMSVSKVQSILDSGKEKLLKVRTTRPAPHLDDKVLTDWNGLMIAALARASVVLGEDRYRIAAEKAALFVDQKMRDKNGRLFHRYRDGSAAIQANLNDHAFLIQGYLYLYEASFDPVWLQKAAVLADTMIEFFWDEANGGFYLTASDAEALISRPKEVYDGALPSGNSAAALALAYLGRYTGQARYETASRKAMDAFSEMIAADPSNYPAMLMALDLALGPGREVVIAAEKRDELVEGFLKEIRKDFFPNQVVLLKLTGSGQGLDKVAPFVSNKIPLSGKTAVYVCRDHACQLPVTELSALKKLLNEIGQK
jgi:hypothetical protein